MAEELGEAKEAVKQLSSARDAIRRSVNPEAASVPVQGRLAADLESLGGRLDASPFAAERGPLPTVSRESQRRRFPDRKGQNRDVADGLVEAEEDTMVAVRRDGNRSEAPNTAEEDHAEQISALAQLLADLEPQEEEDFLLDSEADMPAPIKDPMTRAYRGDQRAARIDLSR